MHVQIESCTYALMGTHIHAHTHVSTLMCPHSYTQIHIHAHTYIHYTHEHTDTLIPTHMHTHKKLTTHIYTCLHTYPNWTFENYRLITKLDKTFHPFCSLSIPFSRPRSSVGVNDKNQISLLYHKLKKREFSIGI